MHKMIKVGMLSFMVSIAASAAPIVYDFTAGTGAFAGSNTGFGTCNTVDARNCAVGDTFTLLQGGITVTATAFSSDNNTSDNFLAAQLFKSGVPSPYIGLGVCNHNEGTHTNQSTGGDCPNTDGFVDNSGATDYVLFTFSQAVSAATIDVNHFIIGSDSDVRWWFNVSTPLTGTDPNGLGAPAGVSNTSTPGANFPLNLTGAPSSVTKILFSLNPGTANDGVKITGLTVTPSTVPEPATFGMAGMALVGLGLLRKRIIKN